MIRTRTIATQVLDAIATQLPGDLVTLDLERALNAVNAGRHAIYLQAPAIDWQTAYSIELTWTIYAVPGTNDRAAGWAALDDLITGIAEAVDVSRARPYDWTPSTGGSPLIAYEITATTHHDI